MASSKLIPCEPCEEGQVKTKAEIRCYECEEDLGSSHHTRSKETCNHESKSYKPSIPAIKTECDTHGLQLNLYCPSHLMPCCDECIPTSHSNCNGIQSLEDVVEETVIETSKESVEKDITSILHLLDKMVNNKSTNIKTGKQQCEGIKESIIKIRNEINKYLDCLEEKLCEETDNLRDQEKSTAIDFISEVKGKEIKLIKMKEYLHTVTTNNSKLHSFLGLHQIEQQVHQCQQYVDGLKKDNRAKKYDIKMKQNDEIENILFKLGSLKSLGEVIVVKTEIDLNRETSVRRKAQVQTREQSNINKMTMNIETKIDINLSKTITDMICLIDGRVIVVEQFGQVYLFTSDGKLQKILPISGDAICVAQINETYIAITYPRETAIKIFNMENETVTKVIKIEDKNCWGLSFSNNSLAVGMGNDEIRIIDLEGNILHSIKDEMRKQLFNILYCNDRVAYMDYRGEAIYCVDVSGKQIWQCKQDLSGLWDLCTDNNGNIILTDTYSSSIRVISKDGQNSKELISKEDGLVDLRFICFKPNESSGWICDYNGTYMAKFNLSTR